MTSLAERLTELCDDLKLTRSELARLAGISSAGVTYWFKSADTMKMDHAVELQKKTGYRAEWIALGTLPKKAVDNDEEDMLEPPERDVLHWYRDLTPTEQEDVRERMRVQAEHNREVVRLAIARASRGAKEKG